MKAEETRLCRDCGARRVRSRIRRIRAKNGRAPYVTRMYNSRCTLCDRRHRDPKNARAQDTILAAKNKPCADCGIQYPPVCMDFDHLPGAEKKFYLSRAMFRRYSFAQIQAEIAKCDVVCANCHRLRTAARQQYRLRSQEPRATTRPAVDRQLPLLIEQASA